MNIILFQERPRHNAIARTDERGRHILRVLRAVPGDQVLMGLINGPYGMATITAIDDEYIHIDWEPDIPPDPLFPVELIVAQIRPICMKRILREAASLGVRKIHVCGADTAEKSYADSHLWTKNEYKEYLVHGVQQAVSTLIPECVLYPSVDRLDLDDRIQKIVLDNVTPAADLVRIDLDGGSESAALAVGPERGWSDRERRVFDQLGFIRVGMGRRVLRTETACSAGLGILLGRLGFL